MNIVKVLPVAVLATGCVTTERHMEGRCYIEEAHFGAVLLRRDSICYLPDEVLAEDELDKRSIIRYPTAVAPAQDREDAIRQDPEEGGPGEVGEDTGDE